MAYMYLDTEERRRFGGSDRLIIDYVWLTNEERRTLANKNSEYLEEQLKEFNINKHLYSPECTCDECRDMKFMVEI